MLLHKCINNDEVLYTLFDNHERVVVHPTRYLRELRVSKRSEKSQAQIGHILKLHCEWLENSPDFKDVLVDEALLKTTGNDIRAWIGDQRAAGLSETTIRNRETIVKQMYIWFTDTDVAIRTDQPWSDQSVTRIYPNYSSK
jgi:hypothetical protein